MAIAKSRNMGGRGASGQSQALGAAAALTNGVCVHDQSGQHAVRRLGVQAAADALRLQVQMRVWV